MSLQPDNNDPALFIDEELFYNYLYLLIEFMQDYFWPLSMEALDLDDPMFTIGTINLPWQAMDTLPDALLESELSEPAEVQPSLYLRHPGRAEPVRDLRHAGIRVTACSQLATPAAVTSHLAPHRWSSPTNRQRRSLSKPKAPKSKEFRQNFVRKKPKMFGSSLKQPGPTNCRQRY